MCVWKRKEPDWRSWSSLPWGKLEQLTLGSLRKAVMEGDVTGGTVMAGQIAGLIHKEQTCEEIIQEIMTDGSRLLGVEK